MKEEFVLDLHTGRIIGATQYMKEDIEGKERLKGRFIPWSGKIPPGGKIDLTEWQQEKSKEIQSFQRDIASQSPPPAPEQTTKETGAPLISGETTPTTSPQPVITEADRLGLLVSAMPKITEKDMTKADPKVPTVAALMKLTGIQDITGPEREVAFSEFLKNNPNWKPTPVTE
jgi:hypothetical protein